MLNSSVVQGECGHDLGEVAEPLFEMEVGSLSSLESVLTGGVVIWLGDLFLPYKDLLYFFLNLGHNESEDRLQGLGGVTKPCPFSLVGLFMDGQLSHCWMMVRWDLMWVRILSSIVFVLNPHSSLA